jgi:hypothetical protein
MGLTLISDNLNFTQVQLRLKQRHINNNTTIYCGHRVVNILMFILFERTKKT